MLGTPLFAIVPVLGRLSGNYAESVAGTLALMLSRGLSAVTAFTSVFIMINNSCTSSKRGTVVGFSQTMASVTRATFPGIAGMIFTWTLKAGLPAPFDEHLVWICLAVFLLVLFAVSFLTDTSINTKPEED